MISIEAEVETHAQPAIRAAGTARASGRESDPRGGVGLTRFQPFPARARRQPSAANLALRGRCDRPPARAIGGLNLIHHILSVSRARDGCRCCFESGPGGGAG